MDVFEDISVQGKLPWKQKMVFLQDYVLNLLLK